MSFTCEACRVKYGLAHRLGWPSMGTSYGCCEDCGKTAPCENLHGVKEEKPKLPKKASVDKSHKD